VRGAEVGIEQGDAPLRHLERNLRRARSGKSVATWVSERSAAAAS
jgi:hypothetical protein